MVANYSSLAPCLEKWSLIWTYHLLSVSIVSQTNMFPLVLIGWCSLDTFLPHTAFKCFHLSLWDCQPQGCDVEPCGWRLSWPLAIQRTVQEPSCVLNVTLCSSLPVSFNADLRPPEIIFKFVFWLGYFNSCVNPVIYPSYSREFRRAFAQILRCRRRRSVWRTFPPHGASTCQARKDSRDSMDNFSSYVYDSPRTLSFSSPCPSPGFHSKSQFLFLEHGHGHPRSRKNSVLVEGITDRPLEPVREDTLQDNRQTNGRNAEMFSDSQTKENSSDEGDHS